MKTIDQSQQDLIEALLSDEYTALPPGLLEKDVHVTDVLHALAQLNYPLVELVFCGGTSLSKAHGLIERMSEDIDLKVALDPDHRLSGNGLKTHLSGLKKAVIETVERLGFNHIDTEDLARNSNRYFASGWLYESVYQQHNSLRPHLSLEFTVRTPQFPAARMPITYLIDRLATRDGASVPMACIAVEETLAEKVLSFLRRHAEHRAGVREDWDSTLVRHIYDTYCIVDADPAAATKAAAHFPELVNFDIDEFPRHADFAASPRECMTKTLAIVETEEQTKQEYDGRLEPLIYGSMRPRFDEAFAVFKATAKQLLTTL